MNILPLTLSLTALVPVLAETIPAADTQAAERLVERMTPEYADKVIFSLDSSLSAPVIEGKGDKVAITAPCLREAIRAYGYYLRKIARVHFSWNGDSRAAAQFIVPSVKLEVPETLPLNYALNYCALSYTTVHWGKKRWERELDLMALQGFRYVLVTSGLEKVWQNFLKELDYPREKIAAFIPSPVYSAWWNMGNLEGEGGPIRQSLIDSEAELGRFIAGRLKELGMEPVLQGYVGFLPHDISPNGIDGVLLPQGEWCHYNRPAVLQPTAPAFPSLAALWYKHLHAVYGMKANAYGGDLFHEGGQKGDTPLREAAQAVQKAMQEASPGSLWLLQAWGHNPDPELVEGTSPEHTVILALNKNMSEERGEPRNYGGRRVVWCELANFGGNQGMYGGMPLLEKLTPASAGAHGWGLLSEGLETNPLYYALFCERMNSTAPISREDFLREYALSRYGKADPHLIRALSLLAESVYSPDRQREGCLENIICARPGLRVEKASTWSDPTPYYDPEKVVEAGRLMYTYARQQNTRQLPETLTYDLADICRQVLSDRVRTQLENCRTAFESGNKQAFKRSSQAFLQTIRDTSRVLATSRYFLLGLYLKEIETRGATREDQRNLTEAFRQLITTWRPGTSLLNDYAHRQYAEMMSHYYLPRWEAYFRSRQREMDGKADANEKGVSAGETNTNNGEEVTSSYERNVHVDAIENAFSTSSIPLLTQPRGNIMEIARRILAKQK